MILKSKKDLIKHLRSNGDKAYNNCSDDYIFNEGYNQHFFTIKNNLYIVN